MCKSVVRFNFSLKAQEHILFFFKKKIFKIYFEKYLGFYKNNKIFVSNTSFLNSYLSCVNYNYNKLKQKRQLFTKIINGVNNKKKRLY